MRSILIQSPICRLSLVMVHLQVLSVYFKNEHGPLNHIKLTDVSKKIVT